MYSRGRINSRIGGTQAGSQRTGFTLLEVMVAVLIISMLMIGVFRFVKSVLRAIQISTEVTIAKQEMTGLLNFVQLQLQDLPRAAGGNVSIMPPGVPPGQTGTNPSVGQGIGRAVPNAEAVQGIGALSGTPHQYNGLAADEMEWVCPAGHGVLTTAGADQYRVTLAIQNVTGKSGEYEIGLRRRTVDSDERNYNWLPLLRPAAALEIRYFEPRGKQWIEAWKDPVQRPSLVRVRVWRSKSDPPYETVIALPASRVQTR